ncbi:MAG: class 1 fructose-bisphosphatase, partial [Hyphomicrobiales bacterium]|nr:class 1 fructose-bisphosphatase [Hyphomicrobiales bacterium]
ADALFTEALHGAGVRALLSEEKPTPVALDAHGKWLVAMDPLDGSSNIDVNVSIGTIFSVLDAGWTPGMRDADFLVPGNRQRAAGFFVYGPQTHLVFTLGDGTHSAALDPADGRFKVVRRRLAIPRDAFEYAINASNYRHWFGPVKAYVDDCIAGADGPRGREFNMRWTASLVADAYRIFTRGGVFLYPADQRRGYGMGRLRHLYEANPIAFLVEQAGGAATDGANRALDAEPAGLHARLPFVFGSIEKVERVRRYHLDDERPESESPLFGRRGLLRA